MTDHPSTPRLYGRERGGANWYELFLGPRIAYLTTYPTLITIEEKVAMDLRIDWWYPDTNIGYRRRVILTKFPF